MNMSESKDKLAALLLDEELIDIDRQANKFNIFEALGVVNQELRHSDFLAFLLDENMPHGAGAVYTKYLFLKVFELSEEDHTTQAIQLLCDDFEGFEVYRERKRIDLLLVNHDTRTVLALENKVWSSEGENQLIKYRSVIESDYNGYSHIFCFLTPDGRDAETDEGWVSLSYQDVASAIRKASEATVDSQNAQVQLLVEHYLAMIERRIMSDSEISELCRKVYFKHKTALDLIFEHKPDLTRDVSDHIKESLEQVSDELGLAIDSCTKNYIRFSLTEWDSWNKNGLDEKRWTPSNRFVLFEFQNFDDVITLKLIVGIGNQDYRRQAIEFYSADKIASKINKQYNTIDSWPMVPKAQYGDDYEEICMKFDASLSNWLSRELEQLRVQWAKFELS